MMMSLGNFIGGIGLGFWKGPLYALALLGVGPPMIIIITISTTMIMAGASASLKAYGQSSGYATQCLNAMKVVVAFGMEHTEIKNYNGHLETARKAGAKEKVMTGIGMSIMMAMIYSVYSYAFWVGANFVKNEVINSATGNVYTFTDILACFFGILFGLFGMSTIGQAIQALGEAQVAGKLAFDIVDRNPNVNMDDPTA
jgi:ABC-type multidrug transport system fused ATPase/permease subunit